MAGAAGVDVDTLSYALEKVLYVVGEEAVVETLDNAVDDFPKVMGKDDV